MQRPRPSRAGGASGVDPLSADALDLRFVSLASGLRTGYVEVGPAEGEPVILLHGFPESHYSWRFQLPVLAAAGYRAIAPGQRGDNRTDKTPPYDLGSLTFDIAQLQDALGIASSHITPADVARYKGTAAQPGALTAMLEWYRAIVSACSRCMSRGRR